MELATPSSLPALPISSNEKLPQVDGLNCWPTTFFIGRDGLVQSIHAGYSGPAMGSGNSNLRSEANVLIVKLLSER
jgi:hypothetical protein